MSTPISRNNKLQGLELYAPRRIRERLAGMEEVAKAVALEPLDRNPARSQAEQNEERPALKLVVQSEDLPASPDDPIPASDQSNGPTEAQFDDVEERLSSAINEPSDQARADIAEPMPRASAPVSPPAPTAQEMSYGVAPPNLRAWREHDRRAPTASSPRRRLEPETVPPPPPFEIWRGGALPLFVRVSLVAAFAAIVAFGVTMLSFSRSGGPVQKPMAPQAREAVQVPQPQAQLVVADQQAFANEPLSLALDVENAAPDQSLLLNGLARGTTVSAGSAANEFGWWLPLDKIRSLALFAPKNFVGVMNTTVDLIGADKRLLDTRGMQLKWIPREPKPMARPAVAAPRPAPPVEPIDPAMAAMLMQRGRDFLGAGDLSAARVMFRRLADAGMADAALALARTYDPDYLAAHQVVGVRGDRAMARALYQRARDLGSAAAGQLLASGTIN